MFLRCGTYGIRRGLWDCGVALMGHKVFDLWGPMGMYGELRLSMWACGAACLHLYDLLGPMGLQCGIYGGL